MNFLVYRIEDKNGTGLIRVKQDLPIHGLIKPFVIIMPIKDQVLGNVVRLEKLTKNI